MIAIPLAFGLASITLASAAPRVSVKELGGFLKVIAASAGARAQGRMDCLDDDVVEELKARGLERDRFDPRCDGRYAPACPWGGPRPEASHRVRRRRGGS
jgi:hypothetical protein